MLDIKFDKVFNIVQLRNEEKSKHTNIVLGQSGLFFFYSEDDVLLYIGWSNNVRASIKEYLAGRPGNSRKFYSDIYVVRILYASSFDAFRYVHQDCKDIQFYLIDKLNPRFNIIKSLRNAYVDSEKYIEDQYKEWEAMKVLMKPIEVIAHFEHNGTPHPLRLKLNDKYLRIEQVTSMTEEKLAGNRMLVFRCQSEIKGELRPFEIKYELNSCKWFLWKM